MNQKGANKSFCNNVSSFNDDSYQEFNSQTDKNDYLINDLIQNKSLSMVPLHGNLNVITEESSFIDEINSNDENNSIQILYNLIKKPHWTNTNNLIQQELLHYASNHINENINIFISSSPSNLHLNSTNGNQSDDEDEYDKEEGQQLIQRLIEEFLTGRCIPTNPLCCILIIATSCSDI
ncbi:unnamed protein product [Rotaria sordida]|uniref:Uncharacterized protein n=1 Tax=Rotaria sordida TaxID=392033 RepID=A0A815PS72_9BILA|nr:unnamed protein product [Rotaria sordida]CAF4090998.1 unnamed protein product [Rotaria sordida]